MVPVGTGGQAPGQWKRGERHPLEKGDSDAWSESECVLRVGLAVALLLGSVLPASAGWQLAWSDEFNAAAWTVAEQQQVGHETGGGGWGNNELQYYTTSTNNARHDGAGNLIIEARRESGSSYTSARLKTQGKFSRTYGKIEARLAIPKGQGLWPAFWMLGTNIGSVGWPTCGEIDIMEHVNSNDTIYGTMHWDYNGYASYGGNTTAAPVTNFHTYMLDWNSWSLNWYVDGRPITPGTSSTTSMAPRSSSGRSSCS